MNGMKTSHRTDVGSASRLQVFGGGFVKILCTCAIGTALKRFKTLPTVERKDRRHGVLTGNTNAIYRVNEELVSVTETHRLIQVAKRNHDTK